MKKIYLVLGGGLGNQMFQYAAARAYALENDCQIKICNFFYTDGRNPERSYSLKYLSLPEQILIASQSEENTVKKCIDKYNNLWWQSFIRKMPEFVRNNIMKQTFKRGICRSLYGTYKYVPYPKITVQEIIMQGGFQSPKYFEKYDDIIKRELLVNQETTDNNKAIQKNIQSCEAVCVHIRRGDFLNKEFKHLNVCSKGYYEYAIKEMQERVVQPIFYVFSNTHEDIEWIKAHYKFPENSVYVDEGNLDYQELQLMYSCKHFILSNSTFSWWAQHLCGYNGKIVCAPALWDKQYPIESKDIYEKNWIIVDPDKDMKG